MGVTAIGAIGGILLGSVIGGALFGLIGAAIGAFVGGAIGFVAMSVFVFGFAREAVREPIKITCPADGKEAEVALDPRDAAWSELSHTRHHVKECSRFDGTPECERPCEKDIKL